MVTITFLKNKNKNIIGYKVKGHANYDEYGRDIVCASVSILTQNTLFSLNKVLKIEENSIYYEMDNSEGYLLVKLNLKDRKDKLSEAQILLRSLELGIASIAEAYSQHVTLRYEEVQL